jgi:hypothetical protein
MIHHKHSGSLPEGRYDLYKRLGMRMYGTTGKVDDTQSPFDRSITKGKKEARLFLVCARYFFVLFSY